MRQTQQKIRTFRKVAWSSAVAVALLALGIVAALVVALNSNARLRDELNRSFQTRSQIQKVFSTLQDAETGQRGFVITQDTGFLEPYEVARQHLEKELGQLETLLVDRPRQQARHAHLQRLSHEKITELGRVVTLTGREGKESAARAVQGGAGKVTMDQIRNVVAEMMQEEDAIVQEQLDVDRHFTAWIEIGIIIVLALMACIVTVAGYVIVQQFRNRLQVEIELRRQETIIETMRLIAEVANQAPDFQSAAHGVSHNFGEGLMAKAGLVSLVDPVSSELKRLLSWSDPGDHRTLPPEERMTPELVKTALGSRRPIVLVQEGEENDNSPSFTIIVPVIDQERTIAVLGWFDIRGPFQEQTLAVLAGYAQVQLIRAVERDRIMSALQDTISRQEAMFNSAIDAIITLNASGSIETLNPAAERLFGVSAQDIGRRDVRRLIDLKEGQELGNGAWLRAFIDSASETVKEVIGLRSNGTSFPADMALSEMRIGERKLFVAFIRDISERKRIEQMKTEFVSTVSHELRTPLTSIAGSLGLLVGGVSGSLPERAARLMEIAHSNSQRLVRLINDILDIEKIESGRVNFKMEPVELRVLVTQAIETNRGFAAGFDVDISLAPTAHEAEVLGDPDRLTQVVTNLLSNAVKFSPRGGTVKVDLIRQDAQVRLTVQDEGPGIPEEFQPRLFSKFAQADSSDTRQKGGTGLGLSIVKEIVTRLNGQISFTTRAGQGTVFCLDFPLVRRDNTTLLNHAASKQPRLLICEDDPDAGTTLQELLSEAGFTSDLVSTAAEAKARAAAHDYMALLIDLRLPDEDGISLIQDIRATEKGADVPVIVISGDIESGQTDIRAPGLNVLDWMQKPVSQEHLADVVRRGVAHSISTRPQVLHVDDDRDILQVVAHAVGPTADITSAETLLAARQLLAQRTFDLVILDVALTDGSGLELLPELHRLGGGTTPVVIFSAQDSNPDIAQRVDAILTKSRASLEDLLSIIERLASQSSIEQKKAALP